MRNISDVIEHFLKSLIELSEDSTIEVQRSSLAEKFQCVPSQINYVISTRFSFEKGFSVESKRGGGGYIRIKKICIVSDRSFYEALKAIIGSEINQSTALDILERLKDEKYISLNEYELIRSIINIDVLDLSSPARDQLRANTLTALLKVIFSK